MRAKLTSKANAVLHVLLNSECPLTATQIVSLDQDLNQNTVQSVLRKLLKDGYIKVAEIVYSGNVLCRSYKATKYAQESSVDDFVSRYQNLTKSLSVPKIFAALINSELYDDKTIAELEQLIANKRQELPMVNPQECTQK